MSTRTRQNLLAAAVYVIAAILFTWPLVLHPRALLGATDLTGDASLNLWSLGWDLRVITEHPSWLVTGRVFDAGIFFPAPRTLAYTDHLLLQALALWPIYRLTGDLVLCYNVLFAGSLVLSALAMHALARTLSGSERGAYVAGLIFGFAPYHFSHLGHIQLQALYFMPLSFLLLHRLFERERRLDTVLFGVVLGLQSVSSMYYGIIGGIGIAVATVCLALFSRRVFDWRLIRRAASAIIVALVVTAPWAIPYVLVHRDTGAGRTLGDAARGGTVLSSYLQAPPMNLLFGRTGLLRPGPAARLSYRDSLEQDLFVGFSALVLAVLGIALANVSTRRTTAVYATVAVSGVALSMGPDGVPLLYSALYRVLFGMAAIRATPRFSVLALCGVAVLAALAIKALDVNRRLAPWLFAVAVLAIGAEYSNGAIDYPLAPALTTGAGQWLREQPGSGVVVCAPMRVWLSNTPCMLQALEHHRPIVNGYSGVVPPFFEAMVDTVSRLPAPESLMALRSVGVEYVVSDQALTSDSAFGDVLVERARFEQQRVYQLLWSPEIESRVRAVLDAPPPDLGPVPFLAGEVAQYRLRWTSGPVDVPAGQATISVAPATANSAYAFKVEAATASWVSRFYEARVTLDSTTSAELLPLTYGEVIDEGKRRIERRLIYDVGRHEVQIVSGGTSIVLPVGVGARDPISALFYMRTLPLADGLRMTIPISDNGRRLRLDVSVLGRESLVLEGRTWQAWKIVPRVSERIDRDPVLITAWVSADERKIPLVVDVSARFGTARLELTSYREDGSLLSP